MCGKSENDGLSELKNSCSSSCTIPAFNSHQSNQAAKISIEFCNVHKKEACSDQSLDWRRRLKELRRKES